MSIKFDDEPQTIKFDEEPQAIKFDVEPQTIKFDEPEPIQAIKFDDDTEEEPSTGDIVKGVGAEIGVGIGGQLAGTAIGTAILPGVGTAIGYGIGSVGSGIAGSIAAQKIEGQEDISWGRAIAAGLINLVPGGAAKGAKGAAKITGAVVGRAAAKEAVKGAAFGATEATSRAIIDEGRLPTREELAQYGGAGALFGGALGAATPKISKTIDGLLGKTPKQIDEAIARGEVDLDDVAVVANQDATDTIAANLLKGEAQGSQQKQEVTGAWRRLFSPTKGEKLIDRVKLALAPSSVIGRGTRDEALAFKKRAQAANELGSRIDRRVAAAIKKDPSVEAKVNNFLAGGDVDPTLGSLNDELILFRKTMDSHQADIQKHLEVEYMESMAPQELEEVTRKILELRKRAQARNTGQSGIQGSDLEIDELAELRARKTSLEKIPKQIEAIKLSRENANFVRREYRMDTDSSFIPDEKLRQAAIDEITKDLVEIGADPVVAAQRASREVKVLESKSARTAKAAGGRSAISAVLKERGKSGKALRAWMGEITEPGERIRGTLSATGRLAAQKNTDSAIIDMLIKNKLATKTARELDGSASVPTRGLVALQLQAGEPTLVQTSPEVQAAINRIYIDGGQEKVSNPIIAGIQDLYSSSVGLSKAVKVVLNPPAYMVQVYGNAVNLMGMGANPFRGLGRATELSLAEFGGLENILSKRGSKDRMAFLKELNEMTEFGIKGENIVESDIRDAFDRGLFSKALEKSPIGFFGKAYSVPDTIGRYIGWKAQQKMLKKVHPSLDDAAVKRMAADVINDTYQNYDRLSGTVKSLSRSGIMPQFASFTAEFMRNQYNQARIIKEMLAGKFGAAQGLDMSKADLGAMKREGAKRLASLTAVYGGTAGAIKALNSDGGVTDENEQSIKNLMPSYDKDKQLAIRMSEDGKSGSYANTSYIVPQSLGLAAFDAAMDDKPLESLSSMLVGELMGEGSFVSRGLMEAINNRNGRGRKISYNEDEFINAKERLEYFVKQTFTPGINREVKKFDEAVRGLGDFSVKEVLARQVGYRVNKFNLAENAKFLILEHRDNAQGSAAAYRKARDYGNLRQEDLDASYAQANESRKGAMDAISARNQDLKNTNHSEAERIAIMKDAGVSSRDIYDILTDNYTPIPKSKPITTTEVYQGLPEDRSEKLKAIALIGRTDKKMANSLKSKFKKEEQDNRRGINTKDSLFKALTDREKVSAIRRNNLSVNDLQRKRLISSDVARAVALGK